KSKDSAFGNEDFLAIYKLLKTKYYNKGNYSEAQQKVENQKDLLNDLIGQLETEKKEWDWKFKTFDKYKVVFTLYGTGGSYDPDEGIITLMTNTKGEFSKYENPANTIMHEITHMGMQDAIIQKYSLTHELKERLVDHFVVLMFKEQLPDYEIQNMGDQSLDKQLKKKKDIKSLHKIVADFIDK
ncbi:MAG: hypothetical protein AAGF77_06770, partial [Bacteroidota bacterium]